MITVVDREAVVAILQRAKDKVAAAWWQRFGVGPRGEVCAGTALSLAWSELGHHLGALNGASNIMHGLLRGCSVHAWNDAAGRTQADVLDLFDAALRAAKETA